jgi:hypothetical protein
VLLEYRKSGSREPPSPPLALRVFGAENAPLERFRGAFGPAAPHPCNVLTPYPSPLAFIAATAAMLAAAVVK